MQSLANRRNVDLQIIVTGSHLLPAFGNTVDEIIADGWQVSARVPMQSGTDGPLEQAEALSRGVSGIARAIDTLGTEIVLVLGDRIEAMAASLAAVTTGRILAHIHGGDLAQGDFDDSLRHAITKLAHIHFPATEEAAKRIIRMGEDASRVHQVGAPGLDRINELLRVKNGRHRKMTNHAAQGAAKGKSALILQHPCGRDSKTERAVMNNILSSVELEGMNALCIFPNTDRGHRGIMEAIESHAARLGGTFRAVPSLHRDEFLLAMRDADVLIGNSSSGIIESATVGVPAVDVGPRQTGRRRCGPGVIHCGESTQAIRTAVRRALRRTTTFPRTSVYGDGKAGMRIARVLATIPIKAKLISKLNSY